MKKDSYRMTFTFTFQNINIARMTQCFKNFYYFILRENDGYTLVETLVASAILLAVLIPAALILGKLAMSPYTHDLIVATQLARDEMERTVLAGQYENADKQIEFGKRPWRIMREVQNQYGLIEIRIAVFKPRQTKPLVKLKTLRIANY